MRLFRLVALTLALCAAAGVAVPVLAARTGAGARTAASARTAAGFRYAPGGPKGYALTVLADGPMGYWRLGEAAGTVANDASGHTITGTYTGSPTLGQTGAIASELDGTSNSAVQFNGTSQYVAVSPSAAVTGPFTLEMWVKSNGAWKPASNVPWSGSIDQSYINLGGVTPGVPRMSTLIGGTQRILDAGGAALSTNAWHHLAFTWDGTNQRIYIDGALVATGANFAGAITGMASWRWGEYTNADLTVGLNGWLDEVAVYTIALSGARITAHYNAGLNQANSDLFPLRTAA